MISKTLMRSSDGPGKAYVHSAHAEGLEDSLVVVGELGGSVGEPALGDEVAGTSEVLGVLEHAGEGHVDGGL
jgi:hypothetical protein